MKKILTALCAATAIAGAALVAAPAQAAVTTTTITPEDLPRGAEARIPHLASPGSTTIVDGDVRVKVSASWVDVLGKVGNSYVVVVERQGAYSVLRVGAGGGERRIARDVNPYGVTLASDGRLVSLVRSQSSARTEIEVVRSVDGLGYESRTFAKAVGVLDILGDRAIVGGFDTGAISWDLGTGKVSRLTQRSAYEADIRANRLATFDKDPYDGGCTVVTSLSAPSTTLFRGCRERVETFSADGKRFASVDKLSDGPGPARVLVRSTRGSLLGDYEVNGYFGHVRFESGRALLLETYGQRRAGEVRCAGSSCVRASELSTVGHD